MKAMIFAAGLGKRLKPLTDTLPKALVPVAGKPLLEHVARKLQKAGVDEIVINVHHFADKIENWLATQDWISMGKTESASGKLLVHVSDERGKLLETGGAVLHARDYLKGCGTFLIHNVDILSDCDIRWLEAQVKPDALATLLVSERKTSRYFLFHPQDLHLVGWTNVSTGVYIMADETIEPKDCLMYAFTGIHILSDEIFELMAQFVKEKRLSADEDGVCFSIVDFYLWAAARRKIYGVASKELRLLDVGKLDALAPAEEFVRQ